MQTKHNILSIISYIILISTFICCKENVKPEIKISLQKNNDSEKRIKEYSLLVNISPEKYASLFHKNHQKNTPSQAVTVSLPTDLQDLTKTANEYKVLIDWQIENKRYIKLYNTKTGNIKIIKIGESKDDIVIIERTLRYYKIKIGTKIIKVDR